MSTIKNFINNTIYGNSTTTVLRIIMGLIFIYSGFFKAIDPDNFGKVIIMYDVSPEVLIPYAAIIFPFLEISIGVLLLIGYKIKASAFVSIILMIFWTIIISLNIYRGKSFDCGCFELSRFGINEEIGLPLVFRDVVFLGILLLIFYARQHILSLDKKIEEINLRDL